VAERRSLFLLAVHPAQQRVHVDERDRAGTGQQPGAASELDQQLPRHALQLTHVAVGERAKELAQRRRGVDAAEQARHAAVADHVQVID
jgi:hypothetical protein